MLINSNLKIVSRNIILVPYTPLHVIKYHNWMKSKELQNLTASEPLSLSEEYEMQKSWKEDDDKCTFIILDKDKYLKCNDEVDSMIGDTNIFITDKALAQGEIEIMIAEESARGKKYGWEAVTTMLWFGAKYIKLKRYEAKISMSNTVSIRMFTKLGFVEVSRSNVFQEVTLQKNVSADWVEPLQSLYKWEIKIINNFTLLYDQHKL
ncbi:alpha/beta-tubulin-N-acetyltransferase 9 isoform X2 [Leptidea sinapis]|uniref:alpha/beta-tubulin-N-acetyltransferase 9 isoform X2 n=1 Tax=Leptidea sinapis TaxID=189913 RepID=UPI0021C31A08|nr:alpha/beta-tubulin-N-acetyltransferase 9 isoform X2 [Leptidea sinapis]